MNISVLLDELVKVGAVSDAQASRSLERYESLEKNKPTLGQVGRYAGIGALATPAIGALGDAISGNKTKLRGHLARAVTGGLTASAIPIARAGLDRRAEMGTLKNYLHEHGVNTAHSGPPTGGKLSEPFEPVEKSAEEKAKKEKDAGMTGITPAKPFAAGAGYDVGLVKGAFATSAYDAGLGRPSAPQVSGMPAFRAPALGKMVQKTGEAHKLHGHTVHQGIPIAIENRKGSVRKGVDKDGKPWRTEMKHPYGYIKGSNGADGEEVDCYVGPSEDASHAHVVHQRKDDGKGYDEDKVMLGFDSKDEARQAYLDHYNDPKFLGPMKSLTVEKLKALLATKKQLTKISSTEDFLRAKAREFADRIKAAAGAPTRGNFMMASGVPAFKMPTLASPVQKTAGAPTTPAGILAKSKAVGAPRVTAPPGPSIAQVAKPVGFGKPISGATKNGF